MTVKLSEIEKAAESAAEQARVGWCFIDPASRQALSGRPDRPQAYRDQVSPENDSAYAKATALDLAVGANALTAALRDVLALHRRVPIYHLADECGHPDDGEHGVEGVDGERFCPDSPTGDDGCAECVTSDGDPHHYPCATVDAITAHVDPT